MTNWLTSLITGIIVNVSSVELAELLSVEISDKRLIVLYCYTFQECCEEANNG
jgi:hypothetical protein